MASLWSPPGPRGLWNYVRQYPRRYADQFNQGMQQFARTRNPVAALGALNPTTPFIQDAALQAGGLIAPQANQLNQAVSQASENLGLGPLSIPEVPAKAQASSTWHTLKRNPVQRKRRKRRV